MERTKSNSANSFFTVLGFKFRINSGLIVEIVSALFFLLFLYAATSKILAYQKFTVQIGQSAMLTKYANNIAWLVPSTEIVICVLLVIPAARRIGLYASFILMCMFTTYIFIILNFAERIPCSCGGILEKMNWHQHLVFNIVFVILAFIGILLQSKIEQKKIPKEPH